MNIAPARVLSFILVTVGLVGCARRESFCAPSLVDTTFQIASDSAARSAYQRQITAEREEREAIEGRRAYAEAAEAAAAKDPRHCTAVRVVVVPPPAPGARAPRAVDCQGRVLVEDEHGHWHDYDAARAPEASTR
jgi:hypothetical protein